MARMQGERTGVHGVRAGRNGQNRGAAKTAGGYTIPCTCGTAGGLPSAPENVVGGKLPGGKGTGIDLGIHCARSDPNLFFDRKSENGHFVTIKMHKMHFKNTFKG